MSNANIEDVGKSSVIMDIARARRKRLKIKDDDACPECKGSGIWPYNDFLHVKCFKCNGSGVKADMLGKYAKKIDEDKKRTA